MLFLIDGKVIESDGFWFGDTYIKDGNGGAFAKYEQELAKNIIKDCNDEIKRLENIELKRTINKQHD